MQNKALIYVAITLLGVFVSSCSTPRIFEMDNSQNPLYYDDAYRVTKIKPEGVPAKSPKPILFKGAFSRQLALDFFSEDPKKSLNIYREIKSPNE